MKKLSIGSGPPRKKIIRCLSESSDEKTVYAAEFKPGIAEKDGATEIGQPANLLPPLPL